MSNGLREGLSGSLTPGQRWTSALALALAIAVVGWGAPKARVIVEADAGAVVPRSRPAAAAASSAQITDRIGAFPSAGLIVPADLAVIDTGSAAPADAGGTSGAPPPSSAPPPTTPEPGPCHLDTGFPVPISQTVVSALATTETTIAALTGQPPPFDAAALLGTLASCPPPK